VSGPKYRDAVDVIKSKITRGDVGTGITLRQIRELTGATDSTSRRVAAELVAEGILENHPGAPYTIIATPEDAAAGKPGDAERDARIASLQGEAAELRQRVGRLEADLAALYGQTGHKYPRRGSNDRAKAAAGGGRQ
jgi:DNA-binding transcriptional MocR family regulator